VDDWIRINRSTPRLVDALPNGPRNHPTVQVYFAGGVPEVLLHLKKMGLLDTGVLTAIGETLDVVLDWWEESERREVSLRHLLSTTGVEARDVILGPDRARTRGMTGTLVFPKGNLAPQGSVVKATAIEPTLLDSALVYKHRGPARVFVSERSAIESIKGLSRTPVQPGDVLVLIGIGPLGTGMEEIYQITAALKYLPQGQQIVVLTDGRFSGVSTGPCIGHVGPEALAGGPIGGLRDGDIVEIRIDREALTGSVTLVAVGEQALAPEEAAVLLAQRGPHPDLAPNPNLPVDTRLWALLQNLSGGTWSGCIFDFPKIEEALTAAKGES
jgi:dihydroxyacid dehydratase/phosphogluconate dehydratase